jgi:hypothetical protein
MTTEIPDYLLLLGGALAGVILSAVAIFVIFCKYWGDE